MIKILFLAANPSDTNRLRLDEEVRAIRERLRMAAHGSQFAVEQEWAVRVADLQAHLLRHQPHIVHFSGHGSRAGEIILEDQAGRRQTVPPGALKKLFTTLKDNICCVVLNACYSKDQAEAIAEVIECMVGMSAAIADESAVAFAANFYQALGFGRDVQTAFDLGCGQIGLENLVGEDTPKLATAPGIDAETIFLVKNGTQPTRATLKETEDKAAVTNRPFREHIAMIDQWYMPGTETTGKYMVILRTRLGRVGYRHLDGSYRIRVEPETVGRAPLARLLTRSRGWKQPGDDGQNRYSTEVQEEQLSGALSLAILALEPRGNDAEVNPSLSPNDQELISRLLHGIELRREGKRDITE